MTQALTEEQQEAITEAKALKGKKRKQALLDLIEQGAEGLQVLAGLMSDEETAIRKLALELSDCFGEQPPQEVYDVLEVALDDAATPVRNAALKRLDAIEAKGSLAPKLSGLLSTKKAREILISYGSLAIPSLLQVLEEGDKKARKYAVDTLAGMGEEAAAASDALIGLLGDPEASVRKAVGPALDAIGVDLSNVESGPARDALIAAVKQGDKDAADIVKTWGEDALEVFEDMLSLDSPKLRKMGAELLALPEMTKLLEPDDDYDAIIKVMQDDKPAVRKALLRFFAALPFPVEDSLEAVDGLYDEPEAAEVLIKFGVQAIPTYKDLLRSTSYKQRGFFYNVLPRLSDEVVAALREPLLASLKKEYEPHLLMDAMDIVLGLDFPREEKVAAIDRHQDHWHKEVADKARLTLEALEAETRDWMWEDCRLSSSIIRHMHRLGGVFTSVKDAYEAYKADAEQPMHPALYDLQNGLSFPLGGTFNTFDAYGETTFVRGTNTFAAEPYRSSGDQVECLVFAETDYRWLGINLAEDSADPVVYVSEWDGEEGSWGWSSLSYFLQRFERPDHLD